MTYLRCKITARGWRSSDGYKPSNFRRIDQKFFSRINRNKRDISFRTNFVREEENRGEINAREERILTVEKNF